MWGASTVFFFFSSRRRHTRFSRDWSSDVCSSDLLVEPVAQAGRCGLGRLLVRGEQRTGDKSVDEVLHDQASVADLAGRLLRRERSEERRVGKECVSRWWRGTVELWRAGCA